MRLRLIAGTINVYEPDAGWKNYHLDVTDRGVWDRDLNMAVRPEFIGDISNLVDFRDGMFDAIQAWHVLEHLPRERGNAALREFHRVLRLGGVLDIEVPDMVRVVAAWLDDELDDEGFAQWAYGEDIGDPADYHRWPWTRNTLVAEVQAAGFKILEAPESGYAVHLICEALEVET
jgi:predicted SAM-dependent methyltransferase